MLLRVDPKRMFWGYDGFWLTVDDPEPQEIDLDSLGKKTKEKFVLALDQGVLMEIDQKGNSVKRKRIRSKMDRQATTPIVSDEQDFASPIQIDPVIEKKLHNILAGGVTSIKREVALIENAQFLSVAVGLEKEGKNRKTVVNLLKKQMEKAKDYSNPLRGNGVNLYDPLIEEEKGKDVEIEMQKYNVESSKEKIIKLTVE